MTGYNVYYGSASRAYTNVVPAGSSTSAIVSNLASGVTYFFAATTYTAAGLESDYSSEASYAVPSGNVPPTLDAIADLMINEDAPEQVVQLTGIGSGSTPTDNEMMNVTHDARERGKMLAESIEMIERIWASDPPYDFSGTYWTTRIKDTVNPAMHFGWLPKPYQKPRPPIAIPCSTPDSASWTRPTSIRRGCRATRAVNRKRSSGAG